MLASVGCPAETRRLSINDAINSELGIMAALFVSFWILVISIIVSVFRFVEVARDFKSSLLKAVAIGVVVELTAVFVLIFLISVLAGGIVVYLGWVGVVTFGAAIAILSRVLAVKWLERFL